MRSIALVSMLFLASPAHAEMACRTIEIGESEATAMAAESGGAWKKLDHDQTQRFMSLVNKEPPETQLTADTILVLVMPDRGYGLVARYENCGIVPMGKLGMALLSRAYSAAVGDGI